METTIPESHYAVVDGIRLHYHDIGEGDPMLLLHGGGPGADSWSNFRGNVEALSEGRRLLLVDMPGFGGSDKVMIESPALTNVGKLLSGLMAQLGIESVDILGNSRGGQVGLKMAIDNPSLVRRLALIGSMPGMQSAMTPMPAQAVAMIRDYYRGDGPSKEKMRTLMRTMVYDQDLITDELVESRYQASLDPEVIAMGGGLPPTENLEGRLHEITCPTLIIWGQDDRAGALDVGLMMLRRIPDARMHIFGRCGHWAQIEHRDEFNRVVKGFFHG